MKSKGKSEKYQSSQVWILIGLAVVILGILGVKTLTPKKEAQTQLPEDQLDQALEAGQPTLAFFHSLDCDPCIRAMEVVDEVFPAYEGSIVLVDVIVSDTANHPLLRRVGVRTIPAFYLYDRSGEVKVYYGVPYADELRTVLKELEEGN